MASLRGRRAGSGWGGKKKFKGFVGGGVLFGAWEVFCWFALGFSCCVFLFGEFLCFTR